MKINFLLLFILAATTIIYSQEKDAAKDAQNPLANIISMPLQNNTSFGIGDADRTSNTLNIQPIYPITLGDDWILINRAIIPIESFPDFKIQIVESFPDIKVKYVESFPGVD